MQVVSVLVLALVWVQVLLGQGLVLSSVWVRVLMRVLTVTT